MAKKTASFCVNQRQKTSAFSAVSAVKNVNLGKIKHLFHTNVLNICLKRLFGENAQALFAIFQNSKKIFTPCPIRTYVFPASEKITIFRPKRASSRLFIEGLCGPSGRTGPKENPGNTKHETRNTKQIQNPNDGINKTF